MSVKMADIMIRKEQFAPGEYYHIFSRTISGIPVFKDTKNAQKMKQAFLVANSDNSGIVFQLLRNKKKVSPEEISEILNEGKKYVDVLCYSIMPDHYHLVLKELEENGVSNFVRKCNVAISKYRNIREEKRGPVFESRFNARHVANNRYLVFLSCYVHLNPLDILIDRGWRKHSLRNWGDARKKLTDYQWSSAKAFLNKDIGDLIISGTDIILGQFKDNKDYESYLRDWSEGMQEKIREYI